MEYLEYNTLADLTRRRNALLDDVTICESNRALFRRFLDFQEYKLKRRNRLAQLDAACINTMSGYMTKLRNVNTWFQNRPLAEITEDDMRRVYDGLEDGTIVSARGHRFGCRVDYYNKIFKSTLFKMAGKIEIAKKVIEFSLVEHRSVRYILEPDVRRILEYVFLRPHRLLVWLAFDIGENINSLLAMRRSDFTRQLNPSTAEPEYRVVLRSEILKRSRTPRSEITNYAETVALLDAHLEGLAPDACLFCVGYGGAKKFLSRASDSAGVLCQPNGQHVNWKDLRSGMACDLLRKGWSTDEVKARLGHAPSSKEIDKYVNYLALDRHRPKAKVREFELATLQTKLEQSGARERLMAQRMQEMEQRMLLMQNQVRDVVEIMERKPTLADVELAISLKGAGDEIHPQLGTQRRSRDVPWPSSDEPTAMRSWE